MRQRMRGRTRFWIAPALGAGDRLPALEICGTLGFCRLQFRLHAEERMCISGRWPGGAGQKQDRKCDIVSVPGLGASKTRKGGQKGAVAAAQQATIGGCARRDQMSANNSRIECPAGTRICEDGGTRKGSAR